MDFFHHSIKICKRSIGRSAVAASAYITRSRLENTWDGTVRDYTHKGDLVWSEVMLPANAPPEYADRSVLWNSVEWSEAKRNAQLARVMEIALPAELTHEQNINLIRNYVQETFVDQGMCADIGFHDKGDGNPHVHIMLTMRPLNEDGTWASKGRLVYDLNENGNRIPAKQKGRWKTHKGHTTDWDDRGNAELWREAAADAINEALRDAGFAQGFVDHRSYDRQGKNQIPTVHEGPDTRAMEKSGIRTEVGDINRGIRDKNKQMDQLQARLTRLNAWAQHEKKLDEHMIAQGLDVSDQNLRYLLASRIFSAPKPEGRRDRRLEDARGVMLLMKDYNITDAASFHEAVKQENQKFYDLRARREENHGMMTVASMYIDAYDNQRKYAKYHRKWNSLSGAAKDNFAKQHEFELRKYREAEDALSTWTDNGSKIDIKALNEVLAYLRKEEFMLNWELDSRKTNIRRLEIVKREFVKNRKEKGRYEAR